MKLTIGQLFKSKATWTFIALGAYNIFGQYVAPNIDATTSTGMAINAGLAIAGIYFRKLNTQLPPAASDKITNPIK